MHEQIGDNIANLISEYGQGAQHTEHINTTLDTFQLATVFKV